MSDPLVGSLSDQTKSRFGRRTPWIVGSALPLGVFWILRWLALPVLKDNQWLAASYFFIVITMWSLFHTCQVVPYRAMIPDVASTYQTRAQVSLLMQEFGQVSSMVAAVAWMCILWAFDDGSSDGYFVAAFATVLFATIPRVYSSVTAKEREIEFVPWSDNDRTSGEASPLVAAELESASSYSRFVSKPVMEYLRSAWYALLFRDFAFICLIMFLLNIAFVFHQANLIFTLEYVFQNQGAQYWAVFAEQTAGVFALPLWLMLIVLIGKKKAYFVSAGFLCVFLITSAFIPANNSDYIIIPLLCGIGISNATVMVVQSMIPDTVQAYEMFSGRRDEAFLYR